MVALSKTTIGDRWVLFVGAVVTVAVGVALVQASLLTLIAAATADVAEGLSATEELAVRSGYEGAVAVMGIVMGIASFVAMFVVGSTFAFTVAQRRRDFAMLRLVGASRAQVRRLLMGEAILLGLVGSALGVFLGMAFAEIEAGLLRELGFVPADFVVSWRSWILAVSIPTGVGIALVASLAAGRRASRVRPLAALRSTGHAERVMTLGRWFVGLVATGGAIAMMIIAPAVGPEAALAISMSVCLVWVIALGALAPVFVPVAGVFVGMLSRVVWPWGRTGGLVHANLREGRRRTASMAAPIMMLTGLVVGLGGAIDVMSAGARVEAAQAVDADLVVFAGDGLGGDLAEVAGVDVVSEEVSVVLGVNEDPSESTEYLAEVGLAIDPASYDTTHAVAVTGGDLARLTSGTVVLADGLASSFGVEVGERATLTFDGVEASLRVVATIENSLAGARVLLPLDAAPADEEHRYVIDAAPGADVERLEQEISATLGDRVDDVRSVASWVDAIADEQEAMNRNVLVIILGLSALYTALAIVNSVVIAGADRASEFAVAQLAGLRRSQVVRIALAESMVVTLIGLALGGFVAGSTVLGMQAVVSEVVGTTITAAPWREFVGVAIIAGVLVALTTVITAAVVTRDAPIAVASTRQ